MASNQRVKKTSPEQRQKNYINTLEEYREEIYNTMLEKGVDMNALNEELKRVNVQIYKARKQLEYIIEGLPSHGLPESHFNDLNYGQPID